MFSHDRQGWAVFSYWRSPMTTIAPATCNSQRSQEAADIFLTMLPTIERVAGHGFRRVERIRRQELINDAVAQAYTMFMRLVARGKVALAFPTVLASYA